LSFADIDLARLLVALAVLLIAAHGMGSLFARFGQPPAIGEIVGGILLGPTVLAAISPNVQHWIFPSSGMSAAALGAIYQLGLLLLMMFAAGAEMRRLLQRNAVRTVELIAGFGMVLPFAAGLGLAPRAPVRVLGADGAGDEGVHRGYRAFHRRQRAGPGAVRPGTAQGPGHWRGPAPPSTTR
jgi:Sodium/hydrogen exchanger family